MSKGSKEARLVSMKFKSQLWEIISKYPPRLLNRSSRVLSAKIKGKDPGYVKGVETTCCMLHGMLQGCTKYPMSKELKEIKIAIIQYI